MPHKVNRDKRERERERLTEYIGIKMSESLKNAIVEEANALGVPDSTHARNILIRYFEDKTSFGEDMTPDDIERICESVIVRILTSDEYKINQTALVKEILQKIAK